MYNMKPNKFACFMLVHKIKIWGATRSQRRVMWLKFYIVLLHVIVYSVNSNVKNRFFFLWNKLFDTSSDFLISISLQPGVIDFWYF